MEDKIITTANGYRVCVAPFLTYDQYIELQKMWIKDILIDADEKDKNGKPLPPKIGKIPANRMHEVNKVAVGFLVRRIEDKNGKVIEREAGTLPIPPIDGKEVIEIVNQMSAEATEAFDKKKATT